MGECIALVDGDRVTDRLARVQDDAVGAATGVHGEDGLLADIEAGHVEGLEHYLSHLLLVRLVIVRSLGQKHRVFLGSHLQFLVKAMVPYLLHIVPIGYYALLDRLADRKHPLLLLSVVSHICLLHVDTHHYPLVFRSSHHRRKCATGCLVSSDTRLYHPTTIVDHYCRTLVFSHQIYFI